MAVIAKSLKCRYRLSEKDAKPAAQDHNVADLCGSCTRSTPWSDVVSGASVRAVVDGHDVRLCAKCTAERAS